MMSVLIAAQILAVLGWASFEMGASAPVAKAGAAGALAGGLLAATLLTSVPGGMILGALFSAALVFAICALRVDGGVLQLLGLRKR